MKTALIGHTGFVGSNLLRQSEFSGCYNSKNILDIQGRSFDLVVCAGASGEKWKANQDPAADLKNIESLIENLKAVKAKKGVLISTIDVYPNPFGVDEESVFSTGASHAYGENRYQLERFFKDHFDALIVRLPGLFGKGLKKNAIFDFLKNSNIEKIHSDSIYQFYPLDWLWRDIKKALDHSLSLINVTSEPVSMAEVAHESFGFEFKNEAPPLKARYDCRSLYSSLWNREDGYLYPKQEILKVLKDFVRQYREGL